AAVATKAGGIASVTTLAVVVGLRTAARAVAQDYFSDRGQRYVATIAAITCRSRIAAIAATEGSVAAVAAIAIVAAIAAIAAEGNVKLARSAIAPIAAGAAFR